MAPAGAQAPSPAPGAMPAPSAPPPPAPTASAAPASTAPASTGGAATGARPTGITILAILAAIGGILGLFGGFVVLLAGTAIFGGAGALLGIAALAYAGLLIAAAYGFWTLQPWAWPLGVAVAIFGIVISVLYIIGGQSIASQLLSIVVDGVILYYLNQPTIRSLFGRSVPVCCVWRHLRSSETRIDPAIGIKDEGVVGVVIQARKC